MNTTEMTELWAVMNQIWPNYPLPNDEREATVRLRAYAIFLSEVDANEVLAAIAQMGPRGFPPTPSEIREAVDLLRMELSGQTPLDSDAAWREVKQTILRGSRETGDPVIDAAMQLVGWRDYCNSEESQETLWRHRFDRCYETVMKRHQREVGLGAVPAVRALSEKFALRPGD